MRLIDADELFTTPMPCSRGNGKPLTSLWAYAVDQITHAPTIDAVPVVRCGECKRADDREYEVFCNLMCAFMGKNDFCSYGERRDESCGE